MLPGSPSPLGAHWNGSGTKFALFRYDKVELCFGANGRRELERVSRGLVDVRRLRPDGKDMEKEDWQAALPLFRHAAC